MDIRSSVAPVSATDVYTDINSLNNIKNEENSDVALKKVAQQFESMFVHELLKNMRNANKAFEEDSLFNSSETNFFRDMYDQQLSLNLSKQGMGLADTLYQQMRGDYGVGEVKVNDDGKENVNAGPIHEFLTPERKAGTDPYAQAQVGGRLQSNASSDLNNDLPVFKDAKTFVEAILPKARKAAKALGLNPLILTAQAALETGWGKFMVKDTAGQSSNNLFNIKADSSWSGDKIAVSTMEFYEGKAIKEQANFRAYESFDDSFSDFVDFLQSNPRYQSAIAGSRDEAQFIQQLHQAGYATDPNYSEKVLSVYQQLLNRGAHSPVEGTE